MNIHPTNTSSHPTATHLQQGTSILRLLLIVVAGLALLGLALAVPAGMGAAESLQPFDDAQDRPPTFNIQPPNPELVDSVK